MDSAQNHGNMKTPILPAHPLDLPGSIKIMLGREASEAIAANGDFHLAAVTYPDATSPPEANGRMILICLPCSKDALNDAYRAATSKKQAPQPKMDRPRI